MKAFAVAVALLLAFPTAAQAKNLRFEATGFTSVQASRGVQVEVSQGPAFSVRAVGDNADRLSVRTSGNALQIARRGWFSFGDDSSLDAKVFVTMPRIAGLSASQGAGLKAHGLQASDVHLSATEGGQLSAEGTCTQLTAGASMGGIIEAGGLACDSVEASASMGGLATVHARAAIGANASMGGQITVSGAPASTNLRTTMGGVVSID
jgi:Putative auto-transporter adhesin, head GIN domain